MSRARAPKSVWVCLGALLVVFIAEAAWHSTRSTSASGPTTTSNAISAPDQPPAAALANTPAPSALQSQIATLTVAAASSEAGYSRDLFPTWEDADHNGCDTRCEVLARQKRGDLPGLSGGGWLSAYDGYTTDDSSELDIDHVVPLAEAWVSGADDWDPATRAAFANDLGDPELVAVTQAMNRSKGDRDPAIWQPPAQADWCVYASAWVAVKLRWGLTSDPAEVTALSNMAAAC